MHGAFIGGKLAYVVMTVHPVPSRSIPAGRGQPDGGTPVGLNQPGQ
jgi:hypothetical protein